MIDTKRTIKMNQISRGKLYPFTYSIRLVQPKEVRQNYLELNQFSEELKKTDDENEKIRIVRAVYDYVKKI